MNNKLGFLNEAIAKPNEDDLNLLNAKIRNNNVVILWILNSISKEIPANIIFSDSPATI